jgi:hypothetical protein
MLLAASGVSVLCWFIPGAFLVTYPIRLFVTFVHEAAHGVATVLTGGVVGSIALDPSGSGLTDSSGGMPLFIFPAGYIGTAGAGALLLLLSRRHRGRSTLILMAGTTLAITLLWVRNPFGFVTGLVLTAILGALVRWLPRDGADFAASFLAVQLCLNAVLDLRGLLWLTTSTSGANDATSMASHFGLTPWFWALLWAAASLAVLIAALRAYWRPARG